MKRSKNREGDRREVCSSYSCHTVLLLNNEIYLFPKGREREVERVGVLCFELIQQPVNHSFQICVRLFWFFGEVGQGRIHGNKMKKKDTAIWSMSKCTHSLSHATTTRFTNGHTLLTHLESLGFPRIYSSFVKYLPKIESTQSLQIQCVCV